MLRVLTALQLTRTGMPGGPSSGNCVSTASAAAAAVRSELVSRTNCRTGAVWGFTVGHTAWWHGGAVLGALFAVVAVAGIMITVATPYTFRHGESGLGKLQVLVNATSGARSCHLSAALLCYSCTLPAVFSPAAMRCALSAAASHYFDVCAFLAAAAPVHTHATSAAALPLD